MNNLTNTCQFINDTGWLTDGLSVRWISIDYNNYKRVEEFRQRLCKLTIPTLIELSVSMISLVMIRGRIMIHFLLIVHLNDFNKSIKIIETIQHVCLELTM